MRGLVIIICLAFAQAEKLGYNYRQSGSNNAFESRFRHRGRSVSSTTPAPTTTPTISNRIGSGFDNGFSGYSTDTVQPEPITQLDGGYNKEFYSYSAPEEDYSDIAAVERLASVMRKNLRVVFIKAPESNALTNAALQLAKQSAESKTQIYVLTKQPDVGELANKLQNIQQTTQSKPAVHFVKYRTPEDAVRAQEIIQNDYDTLGGPSFVSNEGVAPVLDFSSQLDEIASNSKSVADSSDESVGALNSYIPPRFRN